MKTETLFRRPESPGLVCALALAALLMALATVHAQDASPETGDAAIQLSSQEMGETPPLRVQLKPVRMTLLASQIPGMVRAITVQDGQRFDRDQVLVSFDCEVQKSELARARALYGKMAKIRDTTQSLYELNSRSEVELSVARSDANAAAAEVQAMKAYVDRCEMSAPFAGIVTDRFVDEYQHVAEGEPLLEIMDDSEFELEFLVPSMWVAWLTPGYPFQVRIDETAQTYDARVDRLGGKVDPVSRSIKVYGRIVSPGPELMAGMSGVAVVAPPAE